MKTILDDKGSASLITLKRATGPTFDLAVTCGGTVNVPGIPRANVGGIALALLDAAGIDPNGHAFVYEDGVYFNRGEPIEGRLPIARLPFYFGPRAELS